MTGRDERGALHVQSIRALLADYLAAHRGGPFAFKPPSGARSEKVPFDERPGHIRAAIERFRTTVPRPSIASLDARLTEIGFPGRSWVDAEQEFDGDDAELADIGRRLAHDAADSVPLLVGLALMRGRADRRDIGDLGILAMHPYEPGRSAITILAGLPGSTGELRRLASIPGDEVIRIRAVSALCDRPEAVPWLLRNGLTGPDDWSGNALRVAAAVDLPTALRKHRRDVEVVRQAAYALLSAPRIRTGNPRGGLTGYPDAVDAYVAFADACDRLPREDHELIARILGDLYFHVPALLPWPDRTRDRVAGRLTAAIASTSDRPGLVQRARERARRRDFTVELVPTGTDGDIEVCVLVRGRPLLTPLNFGSALSARSLTPDGPLRAEEEPREIELANGNCVPECCGGLFVTIRRDGGEVVWNGFRQTMTRDPADWPELRFDAAAYDAELERTDRGHFGQIADP